MGAVHPQDLLPAQAAQVVARAVQAAAPVAAEDPVDSAADAAAICNR